MSIAVEISSTSKSNLSRISASRKILHEIQITDTTLPLISKTSLRDENKLDCQDGNRRVVSKQPTSLKENEVKH